MPKKQRTQMIVLLALLLVLCLSLFLLLHSNPAGQDNSAEETAYALGGVPQLTVRQLDIENQADHFTITYDVSAASATATQSDTEATASIQGLNTDTLNQTVLQSVAANLGSLPASRIIAQGDVDLAPYGLDNPLATVTVTYTDSTATLLLGDEAPGSESTYAKVGDTVYLVDTSSVNYLLYSRLDLVNPIVTPGNSQTTEIDTITLTGGALTQPVSIARIPEAEATGYTSASGYRMTAPVRHGASADAVINALQTLYGLGASDVTALADGADLDAYGLATPYFTAQVTTVQPEDEADAIPAFTLSFSKPDQSGNVYVRSSISPYIFTVSESSVPAMALTVFDCMDKAAITPEISALREVEIVEDDMVCVFTLATKEDELAVTLGDSTAIDAENFTRFFQTLTAARYDAELTETDAAQTQANPLLRVTYRWADGEEHTVTFTEGPVRRALIALDGGQAYTTPSTYVDRVKEDLSKIIRGETVTAYQ